MAETVNHSERAHAILSASSAYRWLHCPRSATAATGYADESSPYAAEGTLAHEVAELVASGKGLDGFDKEYPAEMAKHAGEYRDYIQEHYDGSPDKVFLLETRVDFSPWVPGGFGTCDCILVQGTRMDIFDYKYGIGVPVSAFENPQMKLYALGAMNDYGAMLDVNEIMLHIFQPRINNVSSYPVFAKDLYEWGEKIVKPIAAKAAKGKGDFCPGEWCRFCPHAGRCRTLNKMCTEFIEVHGARQSLPVLAPFEIAEVLKLEPIISNWLRRVKAQALTDLLDGKEIPGYKAVQGKLGNRKWSDEAEVIKALQAAGFNPEDYLESKLKGPAGIDKLLGKKAAEETVGQFITRDEGAPTIAPITDKREAITNKDLIIADFENLETN